MNSEKATLIKFGHFDHLYELRDYGMLYMNNLPYFWKIEDNELRGDENDSVIEINRGKKGTLTPKGNNLDPIKYKTGLFEFYRRNLKRLISFVCVQSENR